MDLNNKVKFFFWAAVLLMVFIMQTFHLDWPIVFLIFGLAALAVMIYLAIDPVWKKPKLTLEQKKILVDFDFYKTLTQTERIEFERRVSYLTENKDFMGRQDLVVTERMRVLVAATIAQIGFGFEF